MHFSDATILVTGATSGIGREFARRFHALGNQVIATGRRADRLAALAQELPGLATIVADVSDRDATDRLVAQVLQDHPSVNVLVNNAGIQRREVLADAAALDDLYDTVDTNLLAPIRLTLALLPHLRRQPHSAVLMVTSGLAFVPMAAISSYCATKAAMHSWTQSLRLQLAGGTTEVIEVIPPAVDTELSPGRAGNPRFMPLHDYMDEAMTLLLQQPTPAEVTVARAGFLRHAEAQGRYADTLATINQAL